MRWWHWLFQSDAGLLLRIAVGVGIFAGLGIDDLRRNGPRATRWREYAFLLICVLAAMLYGIVNDQITSSISWEYFYYGKDLAAQLGPARPPDPAKLHLAAAVVGIKATWSAGLIIGIALLLANNPSKSLVRLTNRSLLRELPILFAITAAVASLGARAGHLGVPAMWNADFAAMLQHDEMRPRRFMMVYGIHLGGYAGGLLATVIAVIHVRHRRRRATARTPAPTDC